MPKKPKSLRSRRTDILTTFELLFVLHYAGHGTGTDTALKAGAPAERAAMMASEALGKQRVIEALEQKQESALKRMEKETEKIVVAAVRNSFTPDRFFKDLDKILKSKRHKVRGYGDHVNALKLGAQVCQWLGRAGGLGGNQPAPTGPELGDLNGTTVVVYRPPWRDQPNGLTGDTIEAQGQLPAHNG